MQISDKTVEILKNFSSINTNILIRPGNKLSTITVGQNIFATAEIPETFDREFAVYDLNNFLGILTAQTGSEVSFGEDSMTVAKEKSLFKYYYADKDIITAAPDKTIPVDEFYSFNLSESDLSLIMKAAAITAARTLSVVGNGQHVGITVGDPQTPKSNTFSSMIGESDLVFKAHIAIENLKLISGDYSVTISPKNFIHFSNKNMNLKYWVALEKNSEVANG